MNHSIFLGFFVLITLCVALNLAFECGEVKASRGLVANGKKSFKGEWPWLVSLHKEIPGQPEKFFCGASLVNEWTLVSGEVLLKIGSDLDFHFYRLKAKPLCCTQSKFSYSTLLI